MDNLRKFDRGCTHDLAKKARLLAKFSVLAVALMATMSGADSWAQSTVPTPTQTIIPNVIPSVSYIRLQYLLQDPDGDTEGPARFEYTATETGAHYLELSSRNSKPLSYSIQVNR